MDLRMPIMDGLEATRLLKETHSQIAVIILPTYNEAEMMLSGLKLQIFAELTKPNQSIYKRKKFRNSCKAQ